MALTSKKKASSVAIGNLSASRPACMMPASVGVSAEEVEFRAKCLQNLKSRIPDLEKRPLPLFLKEKNATSAKGWLRKALYPDSSGKYKVSDSERVGGSL
jgi:hypothetical protein